MHVYWLEYKLTAKCTHFFTGMNCFSSIYKSANHFYKSAISDTHIVGICTSSNYIITHTLSVRPL